MTIRDLLLEACRAHGEGVALRYKEDGQWREARYADLLARVREVTQALAGLKARPGDRVALFLDNCRQWPEAYLGIVAGGLTAVPVDAKLRPQEAAHVLRDSGARLAIASARTYPVLREAEEHTPALEGALLVDGARLLPLSNGRVAFVDYEETLAAARDAAAGPDAAFDQRRPAPGDAASIIYTSGTTGRQKGAVLTHANFCSNVAACLQFSCIGYEPSGQLVLPLHHAFAFTANLLIPLAARAQISLVESLKTVGENTREVSPTVLVGVPLLLEKMYDRIMTGLRRKPAAWLLFRLGIRRPVIRGIRDKLGGRLRLCVVGGAPSPVEVLHGFAALGIPILEGYGLTETAPVLTLNPQEAPRPGTVGRAVPGVELRILSPNAEGIGEIAARGPNIMQGYFHNPDATAEIMQDDWLLTGDLGRIDADGYLTITGRKKSLIVNREGKNIYPEEVEAAILKSPCVLEALVLGYRAPGEVGERVGAIVVPDQDAIEAHRRQRRLSDADLAALMLDEVRRATAEIADYKRPRRVQLRTEEFEKTSTGKVKRYLYAVEAAEV